LDLLILPNCFFNGLLRLFRFFSVFGGCFGACHAASKGLAMAFELAGFIRMVFNRFTGMNGTGFRGIYGSLNALELIYQEPWATVTLLKGSRKS
jgi:hypothetical protein